jgi:hypothetical protein
MNLKEQSRRDKKGQHAFLSPSSYHWVNYSREKLEVTYKRQQRVALGVKLHEVAEQLINLKIRLPSTNATLNAFVNDAIGFNLYSEVVLYYSDNCFGTADAIGYDEVTRTLRIHDLKTGVTQTSIIQLEIYAALFFLQTGITPDDVTVILRIYQNDEILEATVHSTTISRVMNTIREFDLVISSLGDGV